MLLTADINLTSDGARPLPQLPSYSRARTGGSRRLASDAAEAAMRRTLIRPLQPMRAAPTGATTRLPSVVKETLHGAKIVA